MARDLITSWTDYQAAFDRLLTIACQKISIYDEDLGYLKLESASRLNQLKRVLHGGHRDSLRIALRSTGALRQQHPLLNNLLSTYSHQARAQQTPEPLAHLRDSMVLVDGKHALIRFDREQARSKLLIDEAEALRPYLNRFEEIWSEGGEAVTSNTLGL